MAKKFIFLLCVSLLFGITFFFPALISSQQIPNKSAIKIKKYTAPSGNKYNFYLKGTNKIKFTATRPDKEDTTILLCIPAAFTRLTDYKPDGFFMVNGVPGNQDSINYTLDGTVKISEDSLQFFSSNKGKIFTKTFVDSLKIEKAFIFQQTQLIKNSTPLAVRSNHKYQCRGIAILATGEVCVIESEDVITLATFAEDLASEKKVKQLMYTDMGAWDEGWYKNSKNRLVKLGKNFSQTKKQSNWLIFVK